MIYRKCKGSSCGWNNGDIDVAFQLFSCGMVWDGNLVSKDSRNYLVSQGYAVQHEGMQAMTGKGAIAFLKHPRTWCAAWRRKRLWGETHLTADADRIKRAMS